MSYLTQVTQTFPSVTIPSVTGQLPVEISLIAQLGHGAGNHLISSVMLRQSKHSEFIDELDEPSAKLASTDFARGDATALYSFIVGPKGHPFHRHAGHRIFTAVSGSGGAQLRFSSASAEQISAGPENFIKALHFVNIPPDCMFTVRFGGETWHQFHPLKKNSLHPVFFALSCHTNELGGNLPHDLREKVIANDADIPSLTELLPAHVLKSLEHRGSNSKSIPTTHLSLDAPAGTFHRLVCNVVRSNMGYVRGTWGSWSRYSGFTSSNARNFRVENLGKAPSSSLLTMCFMGETVEHEDMFSLELDRENFRKAGPEEILEAVLEGFLMNSPTGVSGLMHLRNVIVKPLGLRTSPLGCPVSSLLSPKQDKLFAGIYPVLDQKITDNTEAEVLLGANDKHLAFRSVVRVETGTDKVRILLGTRVHCKNRFGRFYMAAIDRVHRAYIAPTMLRMATDYAIRKIKAA